MTSALTSQTGARHVIVVPTYNEREGIEQFLRSLMPVAEARSCDLLFLDDNSPDGTGALLADHAKKNPRVRVIHRQKKEGLGPAYLAGFRYALEAGYQHILQMDSDLSHPPDQVASIFDKSNNNDLVIGSRYVPGGGTRNWPLSRRLLSRGGSFYARMMLGIPIRDFTGGFNCWRADALRKVLAQPIESSGYTFQVELKTRAYDLKHSITEHPIIFTERADGISKMNKKIVFEAVFRIALWRLKRLFSYGRWFQQKR